MRVITNNRRVKRGRFLSTSFSIAGMLMLITSWMAVVVFQGIGVASVPLLLIGVIFSMIGIRLSRKWIKLPVAHEALETALKGAGRDAVLLNHWSPAPHILLTPQGAFTITPRNQEVSLTIDGSDWTDHASSISRLQRSIMLDSLNSPLDEAQHHAEKAGEWLSKELGKTVPVQPLIVFLSPKANLEVEQQPAIPVAYVDKRKPNLKSLLKSGQPDTLTFREIEQIIKVIES